MENRNENIKEELATFGAGCFWCVEAIFAKVKGIISIQPGYCGGHIKNPSYKEVCNGTTGHAEVCHICFDPEIIGYIELLEIFWQTHDPTTLDRQGNDIGAQYRSAIFYHNNQQKHLAQEMKRRLNEDKIWKDPIVTEIFPFEVFYAAEDYHHNYYENNTDQSYCSIVITPKVQKFKKVFKEYLRYDSHKL